MTSISLPSPFLFALLLAACEPDPLDDFRGGSETGEPCETGDGDGDVTPVVVPHVCGGTDGVFLYLETDEACDAGYVHYCYVGDFAVSDGQASVCCDGAAISKCVAVLLGATCPDGFERVCDIL